MRIEEATAKTRKEAIQKALDRLGCELDEVEIEIVDEGSKGFMGIGQRDVHVRVTAPHLEGGASGESLIDDNIGNRIDAPDYQQQRQQQQQRQRSQTRRKGGQRGGRGGGAGAGAGRGQQPYRVQPGAQQEAPSRRGGGGGRHGEGGGGRGSGGGRRGRGGGRPAEREGGRGGDRREGKGQREGRGRGQRGERGERKGRERQQQRRRPAPEKQSKPRPRKERSTPIDREAAEALGKSAAALLAEILDKMDMPGDVTSSLNEDDNILLDVATEHGGILIGRKGKNLESLQFLLNRIFISQDENDTVDRILIDIEGYRKRRKEQLEDMARSMAEKVKSTGRSLRVKPLDPQERRIVHLALEGDDAVRTFSLGNSLHRRVVIAPTEEDQPEDSDNGFEPDEYDEDPDFKRYDEDEDDASESVTADKSSGESDES